MAINMNGCEKCKTAMYGGGMLPEVGKSFRRHGFLLKCDQCNTYWEYLERLVHIADVELIREYYPDVYQKELGANGRQDGRDRPSQL